MSLHENEFPEVGSLRQQWREFDLFLLAPSDSERILYAPLLKAVFLLGKATWERAARGHLSTSLEKRLLRRVPQAVQPRTGPPRGFHLGLGLTLDCTLGCVYCHADAGRPTNADPRVMEAAVRYAFAEAKKTSSKILSVSFAVGGEATLAWGMFVHIVSLIRAAERQDAPAVRRVFLSLTTNGYYGNAKRRFISENFDTVTLSVDGPPGVHDLHRPTKAGVSSYSRVADTVRFFLKMRRPRIGLRATVSSASVRQMPAIVQDFAAAFGSGITVAFEPLVAIGRARRQDLIRSPTLLEFFTGFTAAEDLGRQLGVRVTTSAGNVNRLVTRYCGAMSLPSFAVCVDGRVTACHRDQAGCDYTYGRIDKQTLAVQLDEPAMARNRDIARMPSSCEGCFARWHCAGDCPDLRRVGFSRCELNKALVIRQLRRILISGRPAKEGAEDGRVSGYG